MILVLAEHDRGALNELDLPLAANVTGAMPGEPFTLTRTRWGGSLLEDATLTADVKLLTVQPHAVQATPADGAGSPAVETFSPTLSNTDLLVRVTERVERASDRISMADPQVAAGGGRGVGGGAGLGEAVGIPTLHHS